MTAILHSHFSDVWAKSKGLSAVGTYFLEENGCFLVCLSCIDAGNVALSDLLLT